MFDVRYVPFAARGALFTLAPPPRERQRDPGIYLRWVGGGGSAEVALIRGTSELRSDATSRGASCLALQTPEALVQACFTREGAVRLRVRGQHLKLSFVLEGWHDCVMALGPGRVRANLTGTKREFALKALRGELGVESPWRTPRSESADVTLICHDGEGELVIEEFRSRWPETNHAASFEELVAQREREFRTFAAALPAAPEELAPARELAAYLLWSCIVDPRGQLTRSAVYMSKSTMTRLWSWDNCFNALALVDAHTELAWDQLRIVFDHQHESGAFFDCIDDEGLIWNFVKPPIAGWAMARMLERQAAPRELLRELYDPLAANTRYWLEQRDSTGDGLPEYYHGNDSGWDNGTTFDAGVPVKSPDCVAFLILQLEALARLARTLERPTEEQRWSAAKATLEALLLSLWDGSSFVTLTPRGRRGGLSLLTRLPLLAGRSLPEPVIARLCAELGEEGHFLTPHGLASESLRSAEYSSDGYWRGPIWPSTTLLAVDALRGAGKHALAREVARRFTRTCSDHGFYENFDARSGRGLRDPAYTWTASAFLILASSLR